VHNNLPYHSNIIGDRRMGMESQPNILYKTRNVGLERTTQNTKTARLMGERRR
jgi:hypothetical protein